MKNGLESLLVLILFSLFSKFCDKVPYRRSLGYALTTVRWARMLPFLLLPPLFFPREN